MRKDQERTCCDGLCQQGRHCPAISAHQVQRCSQPRAVSFAPGVIDGPYTPRGNARRWQRELRRNTHRLARALWRYLKGSTPWQ